MLKQVIRSVSTQLERLCFLNAIPGTFFGITLVEVKTLLTTDWLEKIVTCATQDILHFPTIFK